MLIQTQLHAYYLIAALLSGFLSILAGVMVSAIGGTLIKVENSTGGAFIVARNYSLTMRNNHTIQLRSGSVLLGLINLTRVQRIWCGCLKQPHQPRRGCLKRMCFNENRI